MPRTQSGGYPNNYKWVLLQAVYKNAKKKQVDIAYEEWQNGKPIKLTYVRNGKVITTALGFDEEDFMIQLWESGSYKTIVPLSLAYEAQQRQSMFELELQRKRLEVLKKEEEERAKREEEARLQRERNKQMIEAAGKAALVTGKVALGVGRLAAKGAYIAAKGAYGVGKFAAQQMAEKNKRLADEKNNKKKSSKTSSSESAEPFHTVSSPNRRPGTKSVALSPIFFSSSVGSERFDTASSSSRKSRPLMKSVALSPIASPRSLSRRNAAIPPSQQPQPQPQQQQPTGPSRPPPPPPPAPPVLRCADLNKTPVVQRTKNEKVVGVWSYDPKRNEICDSTPTPGPFNIKTAFEKAYKPSQPARIAKKQAAKIEDWLKDAVEICIKLDVFDNENKAASDITYIVNNVYKPMFLRFNKKRNDDDALWRKAQQTASSRVPKLPEYKTQLGVFWGYVIAFEKYALDRVNMSSFGVTGTADQKKQNKKSYMEQSLLLLMLFECVQRLMYGSSLMDSIRSDAAEYETFKETFEYYYTVLSDVSVSQYINIQLPDDNFESPGVVNGYIHISRIGDVWQTWDSKTLPESSSKTYVYKDDRPHKIQQFLHSTHVTPNQTRNVVKRDVCKEIGMLEWFYTLSEALNADPRHLDEEQRRLLKNLWFDDQKYKALVSKLKVVDKAYEKCLRYSQAWSLSQQPMTTIKGKDVLEQLPHPIRSAIDMPIDYPRIMVVQNAIPEDYKGFVIHRSSA